MIAQISRGLAPAICIKQAIEASALYDIPYLPVYGKELVEAKNIAANIALEHDSDLILVEDDILATSDQWGKICTMRGKVLFGRAITRKGEWNTQKIDGKVIRSGTCFIRIPCNILKSLDKMEKLGTHIFESYDFKVINGVLEPLRPNDKGRMSDTYFWYHLMKLNPAVEEIGDVVHLETCLNRERDNKRPNEIKPFKLKDQSWKNGTPVNA